MNNYVLKNVVTALLLLLAVAEAVVVEYVRHNYTFEFENCTESTKLVPKLVLGRPDHSSSSFSPTLGTLTQPEMTTEPLLHPQPHATTHSTPHDTATTTTTTTTTPKKLTYKTTPTLRKTPTPTLADKNHTAFTGKPKLTQYIEKYITSNFYKTLDALTSAMNTSQAFLQYPESSTLSSSVFSSTFSSASPSPIHVTVSPPIHPPHASTLPPLSPTLPLPTDSSPLTTPTPPSSKMPEVWEKLKYLLRHHIPHEVTSEWAQTFKKSYLDRIRAVNHEMVDKLLQAEYNEDEATDTNNNSTCHLPEKRLAHLFYLRKVMVLLLQALPQTVEELEEVAWNPEITDYIFRPERKAVFDRFGCSQCYALDASGVCREMFYCKNGKDVFSRMPRRRPFG